LFTLNYQDLMKDDELAITSGSQTPVSSGDALVKFDQMLDKAGGATLFDKLGDGIENLNLRSMKWQISLMRH
jgi:hypothetical protein